MTQTLTDPLAAAMEGHRLLAVRGPNFSGRTDLLRAFCDAEHGRIYLGPEVHNALSGLATSVRQEIELHAAMSLESSGSMRGLEELQLTGLLEQNPGLLSGGEQACLAVLCGLALGPANLAIDCALEQLDSHRLTKTVSMLNDGAGPSHGSIVTDNRLDEWPVEVAIADITDLRAGAPPPQPVPAMEPEAIEKLLPVTAPSIDLRGIHAGYRKRSGVLRDLTLHLEGGRVYVLLGANGAGKSTCAKLLCGVLRPSRGEIRIGNELSRPWESPGRAVGYHLQNPDVGLFESTVVAELGKDSRAPQVLEAFGLVSVSGANPLALPFPVRKRVSLAATISHAQPWLILDEPTLGADSATIAAIAQIVRLLAGLGHGVIVISHSHKFRQMVGGTELMLEQGGIIGL
jgi:energy-coupling factor transporter ATP-binding protein EcfA2